MKMQRKCFKIVTSILMLVTMIIGSVAIPSKAAGTAITSMGATQGPNFNISAGAGSGFTYPVFNNGTATYADVKGDLSLFVRNDVAEEWVALDNNASSGWIYDKNWGQFPDAGGGFWFNPINEKTYVRLASISNPDVYLDYVFNVPVVNEQVITSMGAGFNVDVSPSGGTGFAFPTFNGGSAVYADVKNDIALFVEQNGEWISIDNNAASGWIYDKNFGFFYDGAGGVWFNPVTETMNVRVASKSSPEIFATYTLTVNEVVRTDHTISNYDGRAELSADTNGALAVVLPKIGGGAATLKEVDNFVYEIKVGGEWVNMTAPTSGFSYASNGYDNTSASNQWGYWTDYIFGLWFQPIQEDMEFRVGYPIDGKKGGDINNNYVYYKFIGNPSAPRPEDVVIDNIEVASSGDATLAGWDLVFQDEFDGEKLNTNIWNYETGYYLNGDPKDWGWGNQELQHYTDSEENVFVKDGTLNIVAKEEPKIFEEIDPNREAKFSSGKLTTKDNFSFTYGRIDFSAKLPTGDGAWPALWMLPNDNVYGTWAASGEIDVMEARGRIPEVTTGAIHYGGEWPSNVYSSGSQTFPGGGRIDDFHTYTVIWEEGVITWYVDGIGFYQVTNETWYTSVAGNDNAPFDQNFYIIMNLAMGGTFDGGIVPDSSIFPATMEVDYVRVYQNGEGEFEYGTKDPDTGNEGNTTTPDTGNGGNTTTPGTGNEVNTTTPGTGNEGGTTKPEINKKDIPQTGDTNDILGLVLIMGLSVVGLGVTIISRKKYFERL